MDIKKEKQRIKDYFQSLTEEEFEKMTVRCGGEIILPSYESLFVKCLIEEENNKYISRKSKLDFKDDLYDFNLSYFEAGQGVA